ncbi:MAG: AAA family ATPase [Clostridia bacterium]|nr:AAA family ATPase [Clostridia bacterium]
MLKELLVENIALIEKANIDFNDGFNVLTGETGAGKSLVIDAINAITGERTSRDLIRTGSSNASVTAVFTDICDSAKEILSEFGIDLEDNLIIKKTINENRSTIRICGQPATAAMVKRLACELINIHGQHDSQALLNPDTHCSFIDSVA